jgi:hypothetical protein
VQANTRLALTCQQMNWTLETARSKFNLHFCGFSSRLPGASRPARARGIENEQKRISEK